MKKFQTKSKKETENLGKKIGRKILKEKPGKIAKIIALEGDLGGGKTTFLKGFAKGLGIKEKILSPTFILIRKFNIKHRTSNFKHFYHIDCYRIEKEREILNLGFREIIKDPKNIVAIEWADKIKKILPKKVIKIKFKILGKKEREILIKWQRDC
jgi:tRNA threonylcarbamoyladenosine biosynthesis protein TsaE